MSTKWPRPTKLSPTLRGKTIIFIKKRSPESLRGSRLWSRITPENFLCTLFVMQIRFCTTRNSSHGRTLPPDCRCLFGVGNIDTKHFRDKPNYFRMIMFQSSFLNRVRFFHCKNPFQTQTIKTINFLQLINQ